VVNKCKSTLAGLLYTIIHAVYQRCFIYCIVFEVIGIIELSVFCFIKFHQSEKSTYSDYSDCFQVQIRHPISIIIFILLQLLSPISVFNLTAVLETCSIRQFALMRIFLPVLGPKFQLVSILVFMKNSQIVFFVEITALSQNFLTRLQQKYRFFISKNIPSDNGHSSSKTSKQHLCSFLTDSVNA